MTPAEPSTLGADFLALGLSAFAYYLGVYIRHVVNPYEGASLFKQLLMGIPLFLALAVTLLTAVRTATEAREGQLVQTLAVLLIFLENGLVINEAWVRLLKTVSGRPPKVPAPAPP